MKTKQIVEMTDSELVAKLDELKQELFFLRFKHATKQLSNPMVMVECKKDIARVKTIIQERKLGIAESVADKQKTKKVKVK